MVSLARFRSIAFLSAITVLLVLTGSASGKPAAGLNGSPGHSSKDTAVFFAADGMRQDIVARYASQGLMPTMSKFLKHGTSATGNGLRTQAPPNTGAGWYSLATGAWPGVHGSTNNTFHINGQPFGNRTAAFDANVLQAESIAQSAERGGLKVAQVEWAGGRNATTQGPTIDFQSFFSGRGVATNFIGSAGQPLFDDAPFIAAFGLQFDHPAGYAGQAPFPGAAPVNATGWTSVPTSFSPAKEMRLRVLDAGVDKYGLNAYIFDSRNDHKTKYDKVLFSPTKSGADSVGILRKGELADVKVKIVGGALAGQTAGMLVKVEELNDNLSRVRLFHTSVSRALATWPTWPGEPGFTGDFAEYLAQKFPTSTAADFAILEAGVTSEETYVEQGLYWSSRPHADAQVRRREVRPGPAPGRYADHGRVPAPVPRARLEEAAERRSEPGVRRRRPQRRPGSPRRRTRGIHSHRVQGSRRGPHARPEADGQGPDDLRRLGPRLRAAVPGDRREPAARRARPAVEAPDVELPPSDG